tara:strand:- start:10 stop:450 length:441 start_codon:yes stop_codon:yes gene_type:complete
MELTAKLDDYGKPAWIGVMVLGFIVFWPVGLAILAYLIWSGRMGFWKCGGAGRWHRAEESRSERSAGRWSGAGRNNTSGNAAFDEYRLETLRRLEDEQSEFQGFLERLRHAKDKAEFDAFMAERRPGSDRNDPRPSGGDAAPQPQA